MQLKPKVEWKCAILRKFVKSVLDFVLFVSHSVLFFRICSENTSALTEAVLFACLSHHRPKRTTTGRLLGPKMENSIKCLSQGHSDVLPHRESSQGSTN